MKNLILLLSTLIFSFAFVKPVFAGGGYQDIQQPVNKNIYKHGFRFNDVFQRNTQKKFENVDGVISNQDDLGKKDWITIALSTLAGGLLGFGTVVLVERLKEPNLLFEVGSEDDDPTNKRKFIHIKVRNLDKQVKWLPLTTNIASSAKCIVQIEDKQLTGRWTSKAEPLIYGPGGPIALNLNEVLVTPREDICPSKDDSEAVQISIGMKYENENEFYAFNNESYLSQPHLKNPKYKFSLGKLKGKITVITLGKKYQKNFIVYNESKNRSSFKLELTNDKDD